MRLNKIFKKLTFLILGSLIFQTSFCQKHYFPGYIISLDGDTIQGFIHSRHWDKNPDILFFKKSIDGEKIIYTPVDIIGFSAQDERYISAIVQNEISPFKTSELEYDSDVKLATDTVFLQILILGSKSLYYYRNCNSKDQFYLQTDSTFELLIYKKYLKKQEGNSYAAENKKYKGQLTFYFKDCPSVYSKVNNTKYTKKSLKGLLLFYYKCTQSEVEYQNKNEKLPSDFGVIAGLSITSLVFSSNSFNYLTKVDYPTSTNFSTGLFYDVFLSRYQWNWSINNELIFSSYRVKGSYEDYKSENEWTIIDTEMGYTYLKLNNMIRFKYPIRSFAVFLDIGISNGLAFIETNSKKTEQKFYSTTRHYQDKAIDDTRKYEQGLIGGLGIIYKRLFVEARYEIGNGMSEYINLNSTTNRYYFFLGYKIKYKPHKKVQ